MIVSLLQLMGFPLTKPVHSRAGEAQPETLSKASAGLQGPIEHAQTRSARRQEVKATEKKPTKAADSKAQSVIKAAPAKTVKGGATPAKALVKEVAKAVAKPIAKPAAKAVKPAAKPVASGTVKAPKAVAKSSAKPTPTPKPATKPLAKAPAKVAKAPVPEKTKTAVPALQSKSVPVAAPVVVTAPAQKTGRPSSRLAQLTVPSMAQSVASTAAKASYSQSIPSPVIVPALPSSIKKDAKLANNWKTKPVAELTDAELLAMSDDDYMNEVQLAAFRLKLSTLKQDILNSAGETTEHLREDTSVVPDPADRATIEEEHALELRTRDRERKLLKKIEQSIGRIDAGDYGYCDETGEPIGVGRLLARPTATLSLEAQQRRELKQKMFGD
jgi:DnaK suppressor protein